MCSDRDNVLSRIDLKSHMGDAARLASGIPDAAPGKRTVEQGDG